MKDRPINERAACPTCRGTGYITRRVKKAPKGETVDERCIDCMGRGWLRVHEAGDRLPILVAGVLLWVYLAKRVFFGYQVIDRIEGRTKFYKEHAPVEFDSSDARAAAAGFMGVALAAFIAGMVLVVVF